MRGMAILKDPAGTEGVLEGKGAQRYPWIRRQGGMALVFSEYGDMGKNRVGYRTMELTPTPSSPQGRVV